MKISKSCKSLGSEKLHIKWDEIHDRFMYMFSTERGKLEINSFGFVHRDRETPACVIYPKHERSSYLLFYPFTCKYIREIDCFRKEVNRDF